MVRLVKSGFPVSGAMPLALPGSVRVRNLVRLNVRRLTPESSVSGTALIPGFVRVRFLAFFVFRGRVRNLVRLVKSGSPVSGAMPLALPGSVRVRNLGYTGTPKCDVWVFTTTASTAWLNAQRWGCSRT